MANGSSYTALLILGDREDCETKENDEGKIVKDQALVRLVGLVNDDMDWAKIVDV